MYIFAMDDIHCFTLHNNVFVFLAGGYLGYKLAKLMDLQKYARKVEKFQRILLKFL